MTVDEFVATKVLPEYQDVAAFIRTFMREKAPQARESISYNMPVYTMNRIVAYFLPNKNGITFSFTYGAQFEDKYGLLRGEGKSAKHVKLKSLAAINREALEYYLRQALALDAQSKSVKEPELKT
jgi:hypothetical protein